MKPPFQRYGAKAFTMIELLVVLAIISVLVFMMRPTLTAAKVKAGRIKCVSNLKQVGLAFRIFAGDNNDKYPFAATNNPAFNNASNAWLHFQSMSNELASAKILICPEDWDRINNGVNDFLNVSNSLSFPSKQDLSVSYFVGLGADESKPQSILTGDRNLGKTEKASPYSSHATGGAIQVATKSVWIVRPMLTGRRKGGNNIVSGDASVYQVSDKELGKFLQTSAAAYVATNNLFLFPQ